MEEKLNKSTVGIAGLGGLGSNVAVSLARIGVGKLILVDFDRVEKSNLNRQHYFLEDVGSYKALALEKIIRKINCNVELEIQVVKISESNIGELFKDVDVLVEALDKKEEKSMLVNGFFNIFKDKKIVAASGISGFSSSNLIKTRKINDRFYLVGDFIDERNKVFLSPRVNIVAHHQANMVLRLLVGEEEV